MKQPDRLLAARLLRNRGECDIDAFPHLGGVQSRQLHQRQLRFLARIGAAWQQETVEVPGLLDQEKERQTPTQRHRVLRPQ